jgi:outer membrane protein assembly factor BamB
MSGLKKQRTIPPDLLISCCIWTVAVAGIGAQSNWPAFRGANAAGVATSTVPTNWDLAASRNVAWKTSIPGLAHSSPIVWGDRIYVTTAVPASGRSEIKTGDVEKSGIDSATDTGPHTWRLIAIDRASGTIIWDRAVHQGMPRMKRHVKASHASATPATDGRSIVALLGSEGLFAFDMEGKQKWRVDLGVMDVGLVDDPSYQWGPASSPVIFEDRVIVQNDRHKNAFLAAYDLASGKELWRAAHDEYPSWATPVLVRTAGRTEIVTNAGKHIRGFDPASGRELWRLADNNTQVKVPTPIVAGDLVIVTGGYPAGGRPIYAIKPGGSGTLSKSALAWQTERGSPYTGTPLVHDGILYVCTDNGILSAYDVKTGARFYQQRVSAEAAGFSASPIAAGDRLYLAGEEGDVFVVQAGRSFKLLATNRMGEITMATPAVAGNMLVVRTQSQLVGIRAS